VQGLRMVFRDEGRYGFYLKHDLAVDKEVGPILPDLFLFIGNRDRHLSFKGYPRLSQLYCQRVFINGFQESRS
jgi:hypothetical protein